MKAVVKGCCRGSLLGVLALTVGSLAGAEDKKVDLKVGDPAPAFTATDDDNLTTLTASVPPRSDRTCPGA